MPESRQAAEFLAKGWRRFDYDATLARWAAQALHAAQTCVRAPENAKWLLCGGTWFIGVNVLPNAADGSVATDVPLAGSAVDFIHEALGLSGFNWDQGQVSVVYPGYPRRVPTESQAAFDYRRERDAAHVDGVLREGRQRRRFVRNYHDFVLGIPLVEVREDTSPFVVWENSHEHVRAAFQKRFGNMSPQLWPQEDVTELYNDVRRKIFDTCARVEVTAKPGEAYLVHRLALHGIAPWSASGPADETGRMIVYFRPQSRSPTAWLNAP